PGSPIPGTGALLFRRRRGAALDTLPPTLSPALLSAEEAKKELRDIVEGFFFRRLRTEDGKRIGRLLVKSPPGLGKTREAIKWAIRYQAEQEAAAKSAGAPLGGPRGRIRSPTQKSAGE